MLRGNGPVTAYHLDTTNPARLSIAARVELRPNDIIFASTKPIYDANILLSLVAPALRTVVAVEAVNQIAK